MATGTTKTKTTYNIDVGNNKIVQVKAIKSSIDGLADSLGYTEDADGEVPAGKTLVGTTREDALLNGCFPIAIYYKVNKKVQRATVLVAPVKADTIAQEAKTKTYRGKNIVKVLPVRRRKFVF